MYNWKQEKVVSGFSNTNTDYVPPSLIELTGSETFRPNVRRYVFLNHTRMHIPLLVPGVVEGGDSTTLVIILQLEDHLVHELRGLGSRHGAAAKVQLVAVKDVKVIGNLPEDILGNTTANSLVPLLKDSASGSDNHVAP